jgi:hypothetical protein
MPDPVVERDISIGETGDVSIGDAKGRLDISTLVGKALAHFQKTTDNRPGDPLAIDRISSLIEEITGEKLYDGVSDDIRAEMLRR